MSMWVLGASPTSSSSPSTSAPVLSAGLPPSAAHAPSPAAEPPLVATLAHELGPRRAALVDRQEAVAAWHAAPARAARARVADLRRQTQDDSDAAHRAAVKALPDALARLALARERLNAARERDAIRTTLIQHASDQDAITAVVTSLPFQPHDRHAASASPPAPLGTALDPRTLVNERDDLSLHILRLHAQRDALERQRADVHRQNVQMRADLSDEVAALPQPLARRPTRTVPFGASLADNARDADLPAALSDTRDKVAIVRGVLQGLILESGLDWVADPRLAELMAILQDPRAVGSDTDESEEDESDADDISDEERETGNPFDPSPEEATSSAEPPTSSGVDAPPLTAPPPTADETGSPARVVDAIELTMDASGL